MRLGLKQGVAVSRDLYSPGSKPFLNQDDLIRAWRRNAVLWSGALDGRVLDKI